MPLDIESIRHRLTEPEQLDYGVYLNCDRLLACQKPFEELCNHDELQFQIVHQVEELWMKLIAHSLIGADDYMREGHANRALSLLGRAAKIVRLMTAQLELLETMSPKDYQEIRLQLGNGSGQESPGFRVLLEIPPHLWKTYEERYLAGRSLLDVYDGGYTHDDAYMLGEALIDYDEQFQIFRALHLYLIGRSIGTEAKSLKGRPVDLLEAGARHRFFPGLWKVRSEMTDAWGAEYGRKRDSISGKDGDGDLEAGRAAPGHGHG